MCQSQMQLDRPTTAKIVSECNKRNVKITAAVEAAFILANVASLPISQDQKLPQQTQSHPPSDLPELYNSSSFALNLYYYSWTFSLPVPTTFTVASRELRKHYQTVLKGDERDLIWRHKSSTHGTCPLDTRIRKSTSKRCDPKQSGND